MRDYMRGFMQAHIKKDKITFTGWILHPAKIEILRALAAFEGPVTVRQIYKKAQCAYYGDILFHLRKMNGLFVRLENVGPKLIHVRLTHEFETRKDLLLEALAEEEQRIIISPLLYEELEGDIIISQ